MKPEFHEDYISNRVDPTAEPYQDFEWDELYRTLGEATDGDLHAEVDLSLAIRHILRWVLTANLKSKNAPQIITRRIIALGWVTNPWLFDGKSISELAAELGMSKQLMSRCSAAASRKFGIENRGQAHAWNRGLKRQGSVPKRTPHQYNSNAKEIA
jgi:hypothetical protein